MDRTLIHGDDCGFVDEFLDPSTDFITACTSGSTGAPKTIRLAKDAVIASAQATVNRFRIGSGSNLVSPLSGAYIAGKMMMARGLVAGASVWMLEPHRRGFLDELPDEVTTIDLLAIVPAQIRALVESPRVADVLNVIVGGAPMTPTQERLLADSGVNAYATYGMTETCSHVALRRIGCEFYSALPGFSFSTDKRGCLVIHSSRMSFSSLVTNDIVTLHDSHSFSWIGRYDNIINSGGVKISPEEIEKLIAPCFPTDINFYATSRQSEKWGEELVIVISSNQVAPDLISTLRSLLGPLKAPKEIIFDPDMQFTPSRKIIRRKF